jgi:elongation of very long chain fatty acids protein 6
MTTTFVNCRGQEFTQIFQEYPILSYLYTPFEKHYNALPGVEFARDNWAIPVTLVTGYMLFCYFGQKYMAKREAFDLRMPLAYWNLFLSTFSFMGMARTVPHLLNNLKNMSLEDNLCMDPQVSFGDGATGLWVQLFIYSKIPELVDTFFIVARKKNLIFLHWYHHVTVLLFCWHSYATEASTGLFFVAMNYSVHAVMYGYYFLMAIKMKPKWLPPAVITVAQISQMVVGTSLCVMSYFLLQKEESSCAVKKENVIAGAMMYGSYLYLFAEFAVKRFILAPKKKAASKKLV